MLSRQFRMSLSPYLWCGTLRDVETDVTGVEEVVRRLERGEKVLSVCVGDRRALFHRLSKPS